MFQTRPYAQNTAPSLSALAGDLDAIARIEASLGKGVRPTSYRGRRDFSRLARFLPDLKI